MVLCICDRHNVAASTLCRLATTHIIYASYSLSFTKQYIMCPGQRAVVLYQSSSKLHFVFSHLHLSITVLLYGKKLYIRLATPTSLSVAARQHYIFCYMLRCCINLSIVICQSIFSLSVRLSLRPMHAKY